MKRQQKKDISPGGCFLTNHQQMKCVTSLDKTRVTAGLFPVPVQHDLTPADIGKPPIAFRFDLLIMISDLLEMDMT
ncbi:MAG: hypothetical protein MRK01_13310 [Candidatus Scalindua sp.]|nr:hypothetical protein [Candidatus Scalindua sp.]